jgi:addiction module RelB/DinJ family antitoxin
MTVQLTTRVDEAKEKEFEKICESLGLTCQAAINIFIQKVISFRGIPFELRQTEETTEEFQLRNEARLLRAVQQFKEGKIHELILPENEDEDE